jgi:hypothetical protein
MPWFSKRKPYICKFNRQIDTLQTGTVLFVSLDGGKDIEYIQNKQIFCRVFSKKLWK